MLTITVVTLALINSAFAGTAWFFDNFDCTNTGVAGVCSNLGPNTCCIDTYIHPENIGSTEIDDICNTDYAILAIKVDGQCTLAQYGQGPKKCLKTGTTNIYGLWWQTTATTNPSKRSANTGCSGVQNFDIHYISLPGEERKPYSALVADKFNSAGAVDWSTRSFNADKINIVQEIISQHGQGLSNAQLAAISKQFN